MRVGWAGVDVFFVLSGFLVSGLLFAAYQQRGRIDVSRFYIRRGLKIWPALYTLIAVGLLVELPGLHVPLRRLLVELFFMQSYFRSIWGITWSLAVEEHFYLILPILLLVMLRFNRVRPFAAVPYVFAGVALFSLTCRFAAGWRDESQNVWHYLFPTHLRIDGLMFGVLLSYYYRYRPDVFKRFASWGGGWFVMGAAIGALSIFPVENRNMHTWGLTLIYLGAGCLVAKAVAFEGPGWVRLVGGWLAAVGVYSYSIYLWQIFFLWRVLPHFHIKSLVLLYWSFFIGAILFGIAAAKVIEIPMLRLRDRVFPSDPAGPTASGADSIAEASGTLPGAAAD